MLIAPHSHHYAFNNLLASFFWHQNNQRTEVNVKMILSETMVDNLHAIRRIESSRISKTLNVPANELGNSLIKVYYRTSNLDTRELITEFMTEAGVVWLRKLLTRDTDPIASTETRFASMGDYMSLLSANDEEIEEGVAI